MLQILKPGKYRSYDAGDGLWLMYRIDAPQLPRLIASVCTDPPGMQVDGEYARFVDLKRVVGKEE
jgi:hypothetical protein